jgi:cyclophilin family peptidyl-prolyl cis-trans isomerase
VSKAAKRERQRLNRESRREQELIAAKRSRTWRTVRLFLLLLLPIVLIFIALQVFGGDDDNGGDDTASEVTCDEVAAPEPKDESFPAAPETTIDRSQLYVAEVRTNCGTFEIALDTQGAPISANNFVFLANEGFYDGLAFTRVAEDFVIQGGSPEQSQQGGPGYSVVGEVPAAGIGYQVGSVAFAKSGNEAAGTAGSQFFVVTAADQGLQTLNTEPYQYALIGQVTSGMDVVEKIASLYPPEPDPTTGASPPTENVVIRKVVITATAPTPTTTPPAS